VLINSTTFSRCLTLSSFSAFVVLRDYIARNPGAEPGAAVDAICYVNSDDAGLDYKGGVEIHQLIQTDISSLDRQSALRYVAYELVKTGMPWWLRLVPYGRKFLKTALPLDQFQFLREAALFDPAPNSEVITWWDNLSNIARDSVSNEKMLQARDAERLSLEYERDRLSQLGILRNPEWVSLEDNTMGYDILSYDLQRGIVVNRLIEVKSTTSDSIFITKNEWLNATSAEAHYFFHIWRFPELHLTECPVSLIRPNIPIDQGKGSWQNVCVFIS